MFRITEDPSSGSLAQFLAKNYKNDSIVSVDMDKVGVMAAYSDPLCVCMFRALSYRQHAVPPTSDISSTRNVNMSSAAFFMFAFTYSELHTRTTGHNMLS